MSPRQFPFFRLLLPLVLGILLAEALVWRPPDMLLRLWPVFALVATSAAWLRYAYRWRWLYGGVSTALLVVAGGLYTRSHDERTQPGHFSDTAKLPRHLYLVGTVYEPASRGGMLKVPLRVEAMGESPGRLTPAAGNLLVLLKPDSITENVRYGDQLLVSGVVRPTDHVKNPHAFDYRHYLAYRNVHYQIVVRTDSLVHLHSGGGAWALRAAYGCRDRLLDLLQRHFPTLDEYAAASALLVGYRDDLTDEMKTAYAETGSMHALAVSGTHVGFLYAGLMLALGRLPFRGRWGRLLQTALVLLGIWSFTLLTGATASVMRASVMFSLVLLGKALYREASVWNVLAASAFGLLVLNPYFLFDAGFQLSYAAVAGMVFFYPKLYRLFPPMPRWADEGLKVLLVGVAAQLGTLPLTLYYFNQFPVYFWLSGWVVVLGGALFLWGGALLVVLDALSGTLAFWFGKALYGLVWGINWCVYRISELPGSLISGIWLEPWGAVALTAALVLVAMAWETGRGRYALPAAGILALLVGYDAWRKLEGERGGHIVVYCVNRQHLIDCFDGLKVFTLRDSLSVRQEQFAAQRHRWAMRTQGDIQFEKKQPVATRFYYRKPFLAAGGKVVAVLSETDRLPAQPFALRVEAVVVTHNSRISMAGCRTAFPGALVVFDGSNKPWRVARWKAECASLGMVYHDVRTAGAWVIDL